MFLKNKKTILIIEDERDIVENIKVRLRAEGFDVLAAYDGSAGVDVAREKKPDLVLLDVLLPRINGFEVCKILKDDKRTQLIPVVMLTSLNAVGDVDKSFKSGADDYLSKPFEYERLLAKIKKYIQP